MKLSKRRFLVAGLALFLTLGIAVTAAAQDRTEDMFQRIRVVYDVVKDWHKDGADLDTFVSGAIQGGLEALGDPHTNYYAPEEYNDFLKSLNGQFSGIGAYLEQSNNYIEVTSPIKGSPAFKAGLKTGDRILEANGVSLVGATTEKAVKLIRGEPGTSVNLKIERPSEHRTFSLTVVRALIDIPEVEWKMLDNQIGYIQLTSFGDDVVSLFYKGVAELKAQGAKGLILDIRQNGGGYLNAAVDIASAFIPAGESIVWEVKKDGKVSLNSSGRLINLPTVALIDGGSASASEILAGALQDYGVAPLVGEKSYGKGTVQQILNLTMGGGMKVTIAEYLTPNEHHVHGIGLTPDFVVEPESPINDDTQPLGFDFPLSGGDFGLDVLAIQKRLKSIGYDPDMKGWYGLKTIDAVQKFARANGVWPEDMVTEPFIKKLNATITWNAQHKKPVDTQLNKAVDVLKEKMAK